MTEEQAKGKWCPFARVDIDSGNRCIASACMAWRWAGTASQYPRKAGVPGFCGLAGRPE
jgi:hypothetical protein